MTQKNWNLADERSAYCRLVEYTLLSDYLSVGGAFFMPDSQRLLPICRASSRGMPFALSVANRMNKT